MLRVVTSPEHFLVDYVTPPRPILGGADSIADCGAQCGTNLVGPANGASAPRPLSTFPVRHSFSRLSPLFLDMAEDIKNHPEANSGEPRGYLEFR